jgi:hypothetical protein
VSVVATGECLWCRNRGEIVLAEHWSAATKNAGEIIMSSELTSHQKNLLALEATFDISRVTEVPTYAPKSFGAALRLLNDLRQSWSK